MRIMGLSLQPNQYVAQKETLASDVVLRLKTLLETLMPVMLALGCSKKLMRRNSAAGF